MVYIIGDIHGQYQKLVMLLQEAGLIDDNQNWSGATAQVWFLGDFFDRGPNGIGVVELVMKLQNQALNAGGLVQALIGNHDLMLLSVYHFGRAHKHLLKAHESGKEMRIEVADFFTGGWLRNGGVIKDYVRLSGKHVAWLSHLPALAQLDRIILAHADSVLYQRCGDNVKNVNAYFYELLNNGSMEDWLQMMDAFSEHGAFYRPGGADRAALFLRIFGCDRLIHGHTPISTLTKKPANEPLIYADGRCINVDAGLYLGGSGFIYELSEQEV